MMIDRWGDQFDLEAWMKQVDEKLTHQAEEIANLLLVIQEMKEGMVTIPNMQIPTWQPRNWRNKSDG